MIKFLITGLIIYGIYRFFIAPPVLDERSGSSEDVHTSSPKRGDGKADEYVDYEEVE